MMAIDAFSALLGKETEKETTFARTWRVETRKQRSLVALPRRSKTALISRSVPIQLSPEHGDQLSLCIPLSKGEATRRSMARW